MLNSVSSYGRNSIQFGAFKMKRLNDELESRKDVVISMRPGVDIPPGSFRVLSKDGTEPGNSQTTLYGYWFDPSNSDPGKKNAVSLNITCDANGEVPNLYINRVMESGEK